ncbi:MAG: hypothetical protein D6732_10155 [Methanobacteriota archaeon]|nr:MAG: hypothetical protein D6732_10155 [Euryarchaeota archaeon]
MILEVVEFVPTLRLIPARYPIGYNIPVIHHSIPHHRHRLVAVQNVIPRGVSTNFFEKAFPFDFNRKARKEGAKGAKIQRKIFSRCIRCGSKKITAKHATNPPKRILSLRGGHP